MLQWAGVPNMLGNLAAVSTWNLIAWIALVGYNFGLGGLVFRRLGSAEFGLWAAIISIRWVVVVLGGGLAFWVGRHAALAEEDPSTRQRLSNRLWLNLGLGLLVLLVGLAANGAPSLLLRLTGAAANTSRWVTLLVVVDAAVALAMSPMAALLRRRMRYRAAALAIVSQSAVALVMAWSLIGRWGLLGAGIAVLASRFVAASICAAFASTSNLQRWSARSAIASLRELVRFDAPLYVVTVSSGLLIAVDVLIVAGFYGAGAAASYGLGAAIAAMAAALLFAILDLAFMRLTQAQTSEAARLVRWMLIIGAALGALGFGAIALNGGALLRVWVNSAPSLAVLVLITYSAARLLSVPGHVIATAAVARNQQATIARVVIGEAIANVALSTLLAATYSSIGPAVASLITVFVFRVVILPFAVRRSVPLEIPKAASQTLIGYGVGFALSAVIWVGSARLPGGPLAQVVYAFVGTVVVGVGLVSLGPRIGRRLSPFWMVVRLGGWRVWVRQRNEVSAARKRLEAQRLNTPVIWRPSHLPLVSVRIATYNRGRLVAERAIASALNQTYENVEVVVVGDHCDDETERAVLSIRDPRVRFENLARRGDYPSNPDCRWMVAGTVPMNRGLDLARGEWIAPLDDDDEFTPDHVEVLLDACRSRDLEFAYGVAEMEVQPNVWEHLGRWPLRNGGIVHASVLYMARIAFLRHDIEAWRLWEPGDWNLWRRMREAGVRMGFVNKVVCRHYFGNVLIETPEARGRAPRKV